ncbi:MAG: ROK family protein [Oscillospiraceae bacterium]|jgi:predicted NBD/HSP70 family sugar kinase|nr:ROK family protein [Oscillospiraceae bacterium]
MQVKGIEITRKTIPPLDPEFISTYSFSEAFEASAKEGTPLIIALERDGGQISRVETKIHGTPEFKEADLLYVERTVKMLLFAAGGFKVYICGNDELAGEIKRIYSPEGERAFDFNFMETVYEQPFEVISLPLDKAPAEFSSPKSIGGNNTGCRIGFDAGGSDRKVSAVQDGNVVYDEEVLWLPKQNTDPQYHFNEIVTAFKTAASHLPRVDAIGVSSAGIYVDNRTMVASLFNVVSPEDFEAQVKDIYTRAAKELGDVPINVVNDGDVSALAGAITLEDNEILGIAMGTSEAVGYVNKEGNITGWLNELAFCPVDVGADKAIDQWPNQLDWGLGSQYFSQDAVIRLAPKAGIELDPELTLAKKLKAVQELIEAGDERPVAIFQTIGVYFAHALAYYSKFYDIKHILLLGRVSSGKGGDILIETAKKVLAEEFPAVNAKLSIDLPDEKFRRLGQSVVAASL